MDFHITKSWMHHGKNRARAIWNHTRQLLPFPRVPVTPLIFPISLSLGSQTAPSGGHQSGESGNAFRKGNLQCGCKKEDLQLTPPSFNQNTQTTHYTSNLLQHLHISVLGAPGIFGKKQWLRARIVATGWCLPHAHETCFPQRALCQQWACLTTNRSISRGKIFLICRESGIFCCHLPSGTDFTLKSKKLASHGSLRTLREFFLISCYFSLRKCTRASELPLKSHLGKAGAATPSLAIPSTQDIRY